MKKKEKEGILHCGEFFILYRVRWLSLCASPANFKQQRLELLNVFSFFRFQANIFTSRLFFLQRGFKVTNVDLTIFLKIFRELSKWGCH